MERPESQSGSNFADMCRDPVASKDEAALQRATATFKCLDGPFRIKHRHYEGQYAQLYFSRLKTLAPTMKEKVANKWPGLQVAKILDVGCIEDREVVAIGTLYKEMKLKPSIMAQYTKDRGVSQMLAGTNFCSESDHLVLEDEGGRMVIRGSCLSVQQVVTGVVVAVKGLAEPGGDFLVSEVCFPDMAPQTELPDSVLSAEPAGESSSGSDKYIALMSGLAIGGTKCDGMQVQLAFDFLAGNLGSKSEQQLASQVTRVVIAGGLLGGAVDHLAAPSAAGTSRALAINLQPVKDLDQYLTELATAVPVDVMPGAEDPTNFALPQQPLHRCLMPNACTLGSFRRSTNPHEFEVDDLRFLGTSGQNADDMAKYSQQSDRLAGMESCLRWRHLAPTAPDTLSCYPYQDHDPFVLTATPHVYFVGNQPEFKTSLVAGVDGQRVRLIMVPSFWRTGTIVLVNMRTLACHPIRFDGSVVVDKQE